MKKNEKNKERKIVVSWYRFTESLVYNFSKKDVFLWKNLKR